jgi:hypothetical protein
MLPATATDEQVTDLIRAMPEHPGMYYRLVDALFAESGSHGMDDASAGASGAGGSSANQTAQLTVNGDITAAGVPMAGSSAVQLSIMRCVERVCSAHSCLQMQSRVVCYAVATAWIRSPSLMSSAASHCCLHTQPPCKRSDI